MDDRWEPVRAQVREVMAGHGIPAAALAVSDGGTEVFGEGFGEREVGVGGAVGPDTVFGVASVTKGFTALAVMQLAEAGKLSVEDPVVHYLPGYRTADPDGTRATTIHHLLTHTAGLPSLPSRFFALAEAATGDPFAATAPPWVRAHPSLADADDLLVYLAEQDVRPLAAPGEIFSYSNEGFVLLGAIIEKVSGHSYSDYITDHILWPLGMERSAFDRCAPAADTDLAALHVRRDGNGSPTTVAAPKPTYLPLWYPAGALNSTARELLRYLEIFRTGGVSGGVRVLSDAGVARMLTPHTRGGGPGAYYGYGLVIRPDQHGVKLVQHGGGSKGISAQVMAVPERGRAVVALTNLADVPADRLALAPVNQLLGLPLASPLTVFDTVEETADRMARYSGTYRGGEGTRLVAAVHRDGLEISVSGSTVTARPAGDDVMIIELPDGESHAQFLVSDDRPAWAVRFGSRVLRRIEES